MLGNKLLNIRFAKYHIWNNKSEGFPNMVLSTETFKQSVRTEYSEAVNARYTFQLLRVSGESVCLVKAKQARSRAEITGRESGRGIGNRLTANEVPHTVKKNTNSYQKILEKDSPTGINSHCLYATVRNSLCKKLWWC